MKVHGSTVIPSMSRSRMGNKELRWLRLWASKVLLLNDEMFEEALAEGFPREQLLFMANPIDVERFRPADPDERFQLRTELGIRPEAFVIVYVGRLSPEKGVDWLLESFATAAPELPGAQLLLVGDGPIRASLEQRASELGLSAERVRFVGRVPNEEVPRWLRAANTFALVSPNEGFSCALAEAMASGLASVVSDIPANSQLVEESIHGSLVPAGDIAATAAAFARQARDLSATQEMGARARQRVVDHYSTDRVVDQYEALFAEIMHDGEASR
jgi:glycosyltransferase involved in cell wall biosynthesis